MPDLDKGDQIEHTLQKNQEFPFYVSATVAWVTTLRHAPQEPCCLELAKCLFDPRKNPSFISWAVQLCARQMDPAEDSPDQISSSLLLRASSIVLDPTFRPIHLAAALDLPEICEYLLEMDPKWNTVSMVGSPLECSIGGLFCLTGSLPQALLDVTELYWVMQLVYATHRQGQVTTMLRGAGCVMQDPPKQLGEWSLMGGGHFLCHRLARLLTSLQSNFYVLCYLWGGSDYL
ncbi:hypothetical protein GGR58DRAFT_521201 [Xylaria digitata]|nr:hypothetical protein GGR58DRAFT_521201 [Xylaria digitata]